MKLTTLTCLLLIARPAGCAVEPTHEDAGASEADAGRIPPRGRADAGVAPADDAGALPAGGPLVHIHLRVAMEPFAHPPGTSGQQPSRHRAGMRSFYLLRDAGDPEPARVFDFGDGFAEVGYEPGDDTIVASVPIRELVAGHFSVGRVVHTHADYTVDATLHHSGYDLPGQVDHLVAMSDRTTLDGVARDRGFYRFLFRSGSLEVPHEGTGMEVPVLPSGGFGVRIEDGEHAYYFPTSLLIDTGLGSDIHMVMEVNMHESFRWNDEAGAGHAPGVFDISPVAWEPVRQFGANSFRIYVDPAL